MNNIKLSDAEKNKEYFIEKINVKNEVLKKQLKNLGFDKDEKIQLLNYNYGKNSLLIKVMDINYAIDKKICEEILIRYD